MNEPSGTPQDSVRTRWPEVAVAVLLQAIAIAVIADSIRVGVGWADDGPRSGYFPFIIGVLLGTSATWILVTQLRRWSTDHAEFAERAQLRLVMQMAVPIALYIAAIAVAGLYVASTALIAWFMVRHGKYRALPSAAVSIGVPLVCFLVFERWFLVQLPKGPLEAAFGL
jgi:putative tricarboxylic transport membrane protein